jgi:hypothetical protein
MTLPRSYADDWKDTRVGRRSQQWQEDIKLLRQEVGTAEEWIKGHVEEGKKLYQEGRLLLGKDASAKERAAWVARYQAYLKWPHRTKERPPGASTITYETVYRFEGLDRARKEWEASKERLKAVYKLLQEPP